MIILILSVFLILVITLEVIKRNLKIRYNTKSAISLIQVIIFGIIFIAIIALLICSVQIASGYVIEKKCQTYEQENLKIANGFKETLTNYENENDITISLQYSSENIIFLINSIPEISSSNLMREKMQNYMDNEKEILNLKVKYSDISFYKWILYFGK